MLSGLLNSPRAIAVNVEIMRAFVRRSPPFAEPKGQLLSQDAGLARKLDALERKYDESENLTQGRHGQFKVVFDAIRQLMAPPAAPGRRIGFRPGKG